MAEMAVPDREAAGGRGRGALVFSQVAGRTVATRVAANSPLRILTPENAGRGAWAFTSSFGGGLVAGDRLSLEVECEGGTTSYVSTQSATKVFRSTHGRVCLQTLRARIGEEAVLVWAPDPVVCFADAAYEQDQRFEVAGSGGLVALDWFTSGRQARGERWALRRLESRNEVRVDGRRILLDVIRLEGDQIADPFCVGKYHCFATLVILGERVRVFAEGILNYIAGLPVERSAELVCGASPLGGGVIVRLAAMQSESAAQFLYDRLGFLHELLGEHPWLRKW